MSIHAQYQHIFSCTIFDLQLVGSMDAVDALNMRANRFCPSNEGLVPSPWPHTLPLPHSPTDQAYSVE